MCKTLVTGDKPRAVILVEGRSDQLAVREMARIRGDDLGALGVAVISMQGVTNLAHHLRRYRAEELGVQVAGLCDEAEAGYVATVLHRSGICAAPSPEALYPCGFFVCVRDLEDELIRAVGVPSVERVIAAEGELRSWQTLQHQPAQRGRSTVDQLRRFFGGRSGNKHRYARLLAQSMDPANVPPPLADLLDHVTATLRPCTDAAPVDQAEG